jgi:arylsulfatase
MIRLGSATIALGVTLLFASFGRAADAADTVIASPPGFKGKIAVSAEESRPWWPPEIKAPEGAPNILIWLIDDAGFASVSAFGGLIDTPNIARLAKRGLLYTNFHATPICSSSRTALLTGRNPHAAGMGGHAAGAAGYPGYYGAVKKSAGSLAKILQASGYTTYAAGKWDQLHSDTVSIAGPFDQWPSGQGFDHYYGFLTFETDNFRPALWSDHSPVTPFTQRPDYHLSIDMADKAISWITGQVSAAPKRPFFLYWATGAVHSPHHAPKAYIEKYRGRFDMGWDKAREIILERQKKLGIIPRYAQLPPRPAELRAWDSLGADEKRLAARQMEVFAAMLDQADHEFGRILDALERAGKLDNTLIIVTGDNGASAEGAPEGNFIDLRTSSGKLGKFTEDLRHYDEWGGPTSRSHYSAAWALAVNTPFNYYKQMTTGGGERVPMVLSWPKAIHANGGIRSQFYHLNDIAPTILDLVRIAPPEEIEGVKQQPFDGVSMVPTFERADAPTTKHVQYFEMVGNRGIYADGWKAIAIVSRTPWINFQKVDVSNVKWELYDLSHDVNERVDLADKNPQKLREMIALFDSEARRNNVYPLRPLPAAIELQEKRAQERQGHYVYYAPGATHLPYAAVAPIYGHSFTMIADLDAPEAAEGVIAAQGGLAGGFALYVVKGYPVFVHNNLGYSIYELKSDSPLASGHTTIRVDYALKPDTSATVKMYIGQKKVAEGTFPNTEGFTSGVDEVFDVGEDTGSAVNPAYTAPFPFTGTLNKVMVDITSSAVGAPPWDSQPIE